MVTKTVGVQYNLHHIFVGDPEVSIRHQNKTSHSNVLCSLNVASDFLELLNPVAEMDSESVESWDGDALGEEECLFCGHVSASLERNVRHMTTTHSFFLPDVEFLTDLAGLIAYLGESGGTSFVWHGVHTRLNSVLKCF